MRRHFLLDLSVSPAGSRAEILDKNSPIEISDRSPRGFDLGNRASSENDEAVQDDTKQPGDDLDGEKWQVSTLSSSPAAAGPLALRGGTKYQVEDAGREPPEMREVREFEGA